MAPLAGPTDGIGALLRLIADPLRLRILGLLEKEELSVGELSRALECSQSRVSNHLRLLREADLLQERHAGTSTYLRLAVAPSIANGHASFAGRLWPLLSAELEELPEHAADRVRLERVLAERRGEVELFDRLAGEWDKIAGAFATGQGRERAAKHLIPRGFTVAYLGCGTGYMAASLLGSCARLVCVDRSSAMLQEARKRLAKNARGTVLEFRQGELDRLPIEDGECDGALAGLVLHHLPALDGAFAEMRRILRPGGTAAVLELAPHKEAWMRAQLGDLYLGLEAGDVLAAMQRAGFEDIVLDPVEDAYRPRRTDAPDGDSVSLSLYIVRGRSPRT
jgi:ArsR family transcriptional regulator